MKIILGSKSPSRKLVLERAGFQFEVLSADIDEKAIRSNKKTYRRNFLGIPHGPMKDLGAAVVSKRSFVSI